MDKNAKIQRCYSELHGATRTPEGVLCIGRLAAPEDFPTDDLP